MTAKGLTSRIRSELAKGPVSVRELASRLQQPESKVKSLLSQMKLHGGVFVYDRKPTRYVSASWLNPEERWPEVPADSLRVAGKITIGKGFRWYAGAA